MGIESANYQFSPREASRASISAVLKDLGAFLREGSEGDLFVIRGPEHWIDLDLADSPNHISIRVAVCNPPPALSVLRGVFDALGARIGGELVDLETRHRHPARLGDEEWRTLVSALEAKRSRFGKAFRDFRAALSGDHVFSYMRTASLMPGGPSTLSWAGFLVRHLESRSGEMVHITSAKVLGPSKTRVLAGEAHICMDGRRSLPLAWADSGETSSTTEPHLASRWTGILDICAWTPAERGVLLGPGGDDWVRTPSRVVDPPPDDLMFSTIHVSLSDSDILGPALIRILPPNRVQREPETPMVRWVRAVE